MIEPSQPSDSFLTLRRRMVDEQIRSRGVSDPKVLDAMSTIPREGFVADNLRSAAYQDRALPIAQGQTISQPFIVAYMTEQLALTPECRVLEVGTGTGYQTAILAALSKHVYSVERHAALSERAAANLSSLHITNVTTLVGDGSIGLPCEAPLDRILVTAGAPTVPPSLTNELADGGILVVPVGDRRQQTIIRVLRRNGRTHETPLLACRFVSLIGNEGWKDVDAGS